MKQGIIFDMDGTLWDSTVGVAESWNEILKQEKVNRTPLTVEDFRGIMGKTMDVIAAKFFPDMPEKERMELLDKCGEMNICPGMVQCYILVWKKPLQS